MEPDQPQSSAYKKKVDYAIYTICTLGYAKFGLRLFLDSAELYILLHIFLYCAPFPM